MMDCQAKLEGGILVLGNGRIRRQYAWNEGHLAAESVEGGACAIAAFSDEDMSRLLGLDGEEQFVIYLATVGKRP